MARKDPNRKCACGAQLYLTNITGKCRACLDGDSTFVISTATPEQQVQQDREQKEKKDAFETLKHKYAAALATIDQQESALAWINEIRAGVDSTMKIMPQQSKGTSEVTPVILASDWHSEEIVTSAQVSGLNEFNLEIFSKRAEKFWQGGLRLVKMFNQDVSINTIVLALLGDFITNDIHDAENAENNSLLPIPAIINVQNHIISGIDFWLNHSTYQLVIICKVGNHSRTTKKVRAASEMGHSLESLMYVHLAAYYRNEPRVTFIIDDGYHTYLDVYEWTLRFHHGHALQYYGGVGGLFIPAYKAINQWNKARWAHLDSFGHFHQSKDGGNFLGNGSLIGYNSFGLRIKGDFEPPKQTLYLMDKKRGRTGTWPILV